MTKLVGGGVEERRSGATGGVGAMATSSSVPGVVDEVPVGT